MHIKFHLAPKTVGTVVFRDGLRADLQRSKGCWVKSQIEFFLVWLLMFVKDLPGSDISQDPQHQP